MFFVLKISSFCRFADLARVWIAGEQLSAQSYPQVLWVVSYKRGDFSYRGASPP
jgi:hypothetical protein